MMPEILSQSNNKCRYSGAKLNKNCVMSSKIAKKLTVYLMLLVNYHIEFSFHGVSGHADQGLNCNIISSMVSLHADVSFLSLVPSWCMSSL